MKIRLRFFAVLGEIVGHEEIEKEASEDTTTGGLLEALVAEHPKLGRYASAIQVAVNHEMVSLRHQVGPGDEIAFLPPVSGG